MEIELVQFGLCFCGEDEEDFVAPLCKFVGKVKECGEMAHGKPWIHDNLEAVFTHVNTHETPLLTVLRSSTL